MKKVIVGILLANASVAFATSFDCTKASTPQERTICSTPTLSSLDDKLAAAYKTARAKAPDEAQLKAEQLAWIKSTRQCSSDVLCIENSYKTRISALEGASSTKPTSASPNTQSPKDPPKSSNQKIELFANKLGPSGWGKCMAGQLAITVSVGRGDPVPSDFVEANNLLGNILGLVRQNLLAKGVPQDVLNKSVKAWTTQIRTYEQAPQWVNECINLFGSISK